MLTLASFIMSVDGQRLDEHFHSSTTRTRAFPSASQVWAPNSCVWVRRGCRCTLPVLEPREIESLEPGFSSAELRLVTALDDLARWLGIEKLYGSAHDFEVRWTAVGGASIWRASESGCKSPE
jgi:hypothetical protein